MCMFWAKNMIDKVVWKKQEGDGKVLAPWQSMISGFSAGVIGPCATGPFDVIKTRLMAQSKAGGEVKYKGLLDALVKIPQVHFMHTEDYESNPFILTAFIGRIIFVSWAGSVCPRGKSSGAMWR